MSTPAIRAEDLGKQYQLGQRQRYQTFRDAIAETLAAPVRAFRRSMAPDADAGRVRRFWALRHASFEVGHGEVVGVIGRNGAGKSTLLKLLSRITEPTEGRAVLSGTARSLLEVGTGFHPELSGRENIFLNGAILGMHRAEIRRKFDEIVAFAEIEQFLDTTVKHYSSGMYMRLAFAVAAHLEPEILLVDEVLAVGDAAFQRKCLGRMNDVAREGRTIMFVSHNMTAIQSLCPRTIWLKDGQISDIGDTHAIVGRYLRDAGGVVGERFWNAPADAPGSDDVRIRSVRLLSVDGRPIEQLMPRTAFDVEFTYWVLSPNLRLNLSMSVETQEGTCAFVTMTTLEPRWHGKVFPPGCYRSVCRIPANLLNDGGYRINVMFVRDSTVILHHEPSILSVDVHDDLSGRSEWYGKWQGVVRPMLDWTTESVSETAAVQAIKVAV
jgi:lipopolysaccharide transport system ATP-binding protein